MEQTDLRYPVGKFEPQPYSEQQKDTWMWEVLFLPRQLEMSIHNLDEKQLNTPYRPDGWNIRQVIHHVADSHMNAFIRFKLGLTEDNPVIKPYNEAAWADMSDYNMAVNISLTLLHALHNRWFDVLKHMSEQDFQRTVFHPERKQTITLWDMLGMYAWHGRHHCAHINSLRERNNW